MVRIGRNTQHALIPQHTGGEVSLVSREFLQALRSLELFATHVAPELQAFEVDALNYPAAEKGG